MADHDIITVSAPGSLMLLGEHAVLHGCHALVCAVNRRMSVRLTPSADTTVSIASNLGSYQAPLDNLVDHPSFRFILQAIRQESAHLPGGFELNVESDFPPDIGFGSSAAVTVATHAALAVWTAGKPPESGNLFERSLKTVREVQGRGSGADVAASVYGGVVCYSMYAEPQPVPVSLPLTAVFCGYKTPTPEVIEKVEQLHLADAGKYERIYAEMDRSVGDAVDCLQHHDLPVFGQILNRNHLLMDEMGVNTAELQEIVGALQGDPEIFGAKISGSGLGDCAVGIGYADLTGMDYPIHHLEITPAGCQYYG